MPDASLAWATEPFVLGSTKQFSRLREWLAAVGFTEHDLATAGGFRTIYELPMFGADRKVFQEPVDTQSLLVQLFLDGLPIPWETVDSVLSASDRSTLDDLGLLQPAVADRTRCVGTVALYPIEGIYVVSDRYGGLEVLGTGTPPDLVFSALTSLTHRFVELMPRVRCASYLELCSGTGVAALLAATQFAGHAYAVDITARATRFATFNGRLNGLANITALEGDLYVAVAGQTFNLISAHPPYVPSFETEMIFRDGGEDGEQVTRRIIAGLADHLEPGGQFYCDCTMTDRRGAPLEQRIRHMLGAAEHEFDVVVFQANTSDPATQYGRTVREGRLSAELFGRRMAAFERLEIESFVSALILIQRRAGVRSVSTRRRILTGAATAADLQWLLGYLIGTANWSANNYTGVLDSRPRCLPQTELRTRALLRDGQWNIAACQLATRAPFAAEADCPSWFGTLLSWCDGKTTAREHLIRLRAAGVVPDSASDAQFALLIRELADGPFVELDGYPMPSPSAKPT